MMQRVPRKGAKNVNEKHFEVELPEAVLTGFGWQEAEVPQRVREALVMELLRLERLSETEAANFLGLNRRELLATMGRYHVPVTQLSQEELKEEMATEIKRGDRP
jgi:hypothetical protein